MNVFKFFTDGKLSFEYYASFADNVEPLAHRTNMYEYFEVTHNVILTTDFDSASVNSFTSQIGCFTHISTSIFRISVKNIKSYIAKIMRCTEAMTCFNRNSIDKPIKLKRI